MTRAVVNQNDWAWHSVAAQALRNDAASSLAWDRLNTATGDLPFLCADAVATALEVFGNGTERLFVGTRGGEVAAMLVLTPQGPLRWSLFQPSQLPLGPVVVAQGVSLTQIGRSLLRSALRRCLVLSLTQLDPHITAREQDGLAIRHADYIDTGWIDVEGGFDQYWAQRGKNLRQNMRKQRNKLAAENVRTQMRVWREPEHMAPAVGRYGLLESSGWKSNDGTAIHPDNAQGRLYTRWLESAARRGEAVVYEYLFDDRTVAMNLCLQRSGLLVVLKTTYDESIKQFSPAFLLREEELQSLFGGSDVKRIEYYGKLMDWHTKLTDKKRMLHHLTLYRWAWLKRLAESRPQKTAKPQATEATATSP